MSMAVRRRLPGAAPECELARGLGKPVAENLLGRKSAFLEPRPNCLGGFAALPEIRRGELGSCIELLRNHAVDLTSKTGSHRRLGLSCSTSSISDRLSRIVEHHSTLGSSAGETSCLSNWRRIRLICDQSCRRSDFPKLSISSARLAQSSGRFEFLTARNAAARSWVHRKKSRSYSSLVSG